MTLFSLLYASTSTFPQKDSEVAVAAIVDASQLRNRDLGVTGCLVFGGKLFAQILEGGQASVEVLMTSITRDLRHKDVTILDQGNIATRRFPNWSLGYTGPSLFVQRTIAIPAFKELTGSRGAVLDLKRLIEVFYGSSDPR